MARQEVSLANPAQGAFKRASVSLSELADKIYAFSHLSS